jgi:hypothetical protein
MGTQEAAVIFGRTLPSQWLFFLPAQQWSTVHPTIGSFVTALTPVASALRSSLRLLPAQHNSPDPARA